MLKTKIATVSSIIFFQSESFLQKRTFILEKDTFVGELKQ